MIYQLNFKSALQNLSFSFFLIILGLSFYLLSIYQVIFIDLMTIAILIIIPLLITLLLFLDYVKNSTKAEILINHNELKVLNSKNKILIPKIDIIKVTVFGAPSIYRKSMFRLMPFEAFHYVEIQCKGRDNIIITSLSDYYLYWNICKESIFVDKIYLNRAGFSNKGNLINSITWNKME